QDSPQAWVLSHLERQAARGQDSQATLAAAMARHGQVVLPAPARLGSDSSQDPYIAERLRPGADPSVVHRAPAAAILALPDPTLLDVAAALGHTLIHTDHDHITRSDLAVMRTGDGLLPSLGTAVAALSRQVPPNRIS